MSAECNCDTGLNNLHEANCVTNPDILRKFIFVEYFKADGTVNGLDLSTPVTEAVIDALLAQSDKTLRWYLTDKFKNFTTDRADPNFESVDNENLFVSQGTRTVSGNFYNTSPALSKKLNGNRCVELGHFMVDSANGLTGELTRNLFLDPVQINKETFWAKAIFATESNVFNVQFTFEWDRLACDGNLRTLPFSDHGTNLLAKIGLIDVFARNGVANSATEIQTDFYTVDGTATGDAFTGLLIGDFTVFNVTTGLAVVPTLLVESPDGTYVLTIPAQTAADVLTVTATQSNFDFSATVNDTITAL